jgi:hypothetical protein
MLEPLAPGMVRWPGLRVRLEEMVQDMQQGQHMLPVAAELGLPNIVDNHVPDLFASVVLGQKVLGERRCDYFREVFVFGNGEHLLFGQAAEGDAIFQRNHVRARLLMKASRWGCFSESQKPRQPS